MGDFLGKIPQGVALCRDGLDGRQLLVLGAFLGDARTADFGRAEAGRQALGAERGIGLTLAVNDGAEVLQEGGQVGFYPLTPTRGQRRQGRPPHWGVPASLCAG